eukprot:6186812-Pleurochrysis_carterae.AAC.1
MHASLCLLEQVEMLSSALLREIEGMYGADCAISADLGRVISSVSAARIGDLIGGGHGGRVLCGGRVDPEKRCGIHG